MQSHNENLIGIPHVWAARCNTQDIEQLSKEAEAILIANCSCFIHFKEDNAGAVREEVR